MGLTWILGTRWWLQLEQPRKSAPLVVSSLWHSWSDHSGKIGVVSFLLPADFCFGSLVVQFGNPISLKHEVISLFLFARAFQIHNSSFCCELHTLVRYICF